MSKNHEKNIYFDRLIPKSSIDIYILLPIIFKIVSSISLQNVKFVNPLIIEILKNLIIYYYINKTFNKKERDYCKKIRLNSKDKMTQIIHGALRKKDEKRMKKHMKEKKIKNNFLKILKPYQPKKFNGYIQGNRIYEEYQEKNVDYLTLNCIKNNNYSYVKKPKGKSWKITKIKKDTYSIYFEDCKKYLSSSSYNFFVMDDKLLYNKKNNNTWNIKTDDEGNIYLISNSIVNNKKTDSSGEYLSSNSNSDIKWVNRNSLIKDDSWIFSKKGKKIKKKETKEDKSKKKLMDAYKSCVEQIKLKQQFLSISNQNIDEMEYDPIIENIRCIGKKTTQVLKEDINKSIKEIGKPEDKVTNIIVNMDKSQHNIHKFNKSNNIKENSLRIFGQVELITLLFSFIPFVKNFLGQYNSSIFSNVLWGVLLLILYRRINKKNRNNLNLYCNRNRMKNKKKMKKGILYEYKYLAIIIVSTLTNAFIGVMSKSGE